MKFDKLNMRSFCLLLALSLPPPPLFSIAPTPSTNKGTQGAEVIERPDILCTKKKIFVFVFYVLRFTKSFGYNNGSITNQQTKWYFFFVFLFCFKC